MILLIWHNKYLQWDPKDYDGIKDFYSKEIFIPELSLIHLNDEFYEFNATNFIKSQINLHSDGFNFIKMNLSLEIVCLQNSHYFPFDKLECHIYFSSISHIFQDVNNKLFI